MLILDDMVDGGWNTKLKWWLTCQVTTWRCLCQLSNTQLSTTDLDLVIYIKVLIQVCISDTVPGSKLE